MIRNNFETKEEAIKYLEEEINLINNKQSLLSRSERDKIVLLLKKPEILVKKETKTSINVEKIIKDINLLSKPCELITKEDDIVGIIKKLKETLLAVGGLGLTANQIGINKRISYVKIPRLIKDKIEWIELVLINAKIIEKDQITRVNNEACLSFPGITVTTKRYVFITVEYLDENLKPQVMSYQDLEALVLQHEIDHTNGITIFDRKWRAK